MVLQPFPRPPPQLQVFFPSNESPPNVGVIQPLPTLLPPPWIHPDQYAPEVYNGLFESIQSMKKSAKTQRLKNTAKALWTLATAPAMSPVQRVAIPPTSEGGGYPTQKLTNAPIITTSTDPTAPGRLKSKPHMHLRKTRNNTPGAVPPIQVVPVHPVQHQSKCLNQALEESEISQLVPHPALKVQYYLPGGPQCHHE